jgi:hypothetical protein
MVTKPTIVMNVKNATLRRLLESGLDMSADAMREHAEQRRTIRRWARPDEYIALRKWQLPLTPAQEAWMRESYRRVVDECGGPAKAEPWMLEAAGMVSEATAESIDDDEESGI